MALGFFLLSRADTLTQLYLSMPLIGLGLGFNFPNLTIWLMARVPATMRGRASGGISTAVFLGQFLSPLLSQPLVNHFGLGSAFFGVMLMMMLMVVLPSAILMWRNQRALG